jgi:hypothetical protein
MTEKLKRKMTVETRSISKSERRKINRRNYSTS